MASLFRGRRRRSPEEDGEDGSGSGRDKRRRLSPEEDGLSLVEAGAAAEGSSPGWLSTFVSGAKRVISSVLFSSPEEEASGEAEEESEEGSDGNEHDHDTHEALVSYSESKLVIEEMVMKETFSRDECDKMVKLIQSRVADSTIPEAYEYGTPKEVPSRNAGAGHDFTGAWRSLNRNRNFSESVPFSSTEPGSFSPGSPLQASPQLCSAAVMEAKKWLEEKRHGLSSKPDEHGPCTLNTDMLNSDFAFHKGSPVDLAKSYMQSLPPWQSPPLLGSQKFKTPPSGGLHINDDEGKFNYLSSSKITTKEDYLSNFWENLEESRRAQIRSSETSTDAPKLRHNGSTSRLFENDFSVFLSSTREEVGEPVQSCKGSDKVAEAEPVSGSSLPIAPNKDGNNGTVDSVDPAKDSSNLGEECHPTSEVHPDEVGQGNHMPPTSVTDAPNHSGDVKAPSGEPEVHEGSHSISTAELRPKDASPRTRSRTVPELRPKDASPRTRSRTVPELRPKDASPRTRSRTVPELRPKDASPQTRSSLRSLKKKIQSSINGSSNKTSANGLVDQPNGNSELESSGNDNPICTNSSSDVPPTSNDNVESTADAANGNAVDNGTRVDPEKPVEEVTRPSSTADAANGNAVDNGTRMDPEKPVEEVTRPSSTADAANGNAVDNGTRMDPEKPVEEVPRPSSTADAANGNAVDSDKRMDPEKPVKEVPKPSYVRRGRKRVVRSRGRAN